MSKLFNTLRDVLTPYANKINSHTEEIEEIQSDISEVKADLEDDSKNLLWTLNKGDESTRWNLVYGYYSLVSKELVYYPMSNKRYLASKYPVSVSAGDVIHLIDTIGTRYFVHYSETPDNTGWETLITTTNRDISIPNDGYVLISARNEPSSVAFTDTDINTFFDNRLVITKNNFNTGVTERLANADILNGVQANYSRYKQIYITNSEQTLIINGDTNISVPCSQGDVLQIKATLSPTVYPEGFSVVSLSIREQNNSGTTKVTNVTDMSDVVTYEVSNINTIRIAFVLSLTKASAQSIQTGYYENIEYSLAVKKVENGDGGLDSVCTEAGDTWEV